MRPSSGRDAWGDAAEVLADPRGPAPAGVVRRRRRTVAAVVIGGLLSAGAGVALALTTDVDVGGSVEAPVVQVVVGLVVSAAGLVVQFVGVRRQWRVNRGMSAWRGPSMALSRTQRKQVAEQVRGRRPVEVGTEDLTVHAARTMVRQRAAVLVCAGATALWIGLWIAFPSTWRALLAIAFTVLLAGIAVFAERDARDGQRFLASRGGT